MTWWASRYKKQGRVRVGVWWWGDLAPQRNAWVVRRPHTPGEFSDLDDWEALHEHDGENPGFEAALSLFQMHMPKMVAATCDRRSTILLSLTCSLSVERGIDTTAHSHARLLTDSFIGSISQSDFPSFLHSLTRRAKLRRLLRSGAMGTHGSRELILATGGRPVSSCKRQSNRLVHSALSSKKMLHTAQCQEEKWKTERSRGPKSWLLS